MGKEILTLLRLKKQQILLPYDSYSFKKCST